MQHGLEGQYGLLVTRFVLCGSQNRSMMKMDLISSTGSMHQFIAIQIVYRCCIHIHHQEARVIPWIGDDSLIGQSKPGWVHGSLIQKLSSELK